MIVKQMLQRWNKPPRTRILSLTREQWVSFGALLVTLFTCFLTVRLSVKDSLSLEQTVVGINKTTNPSGYAALVIDPAVIATSGGDSYSLSTTETDVITVENVTREYTRCIINQTFGQNVTVRFLGWKIEGTSIILHPGASLSWDTVSQYMNNSTRTLKLMGQWDYHTSRSVGFYIRYDSAAVDIRFVLKHCKA